MILAGHVLTVLCMKEMVFLNSARRGKLRTAVSNIELAINIVRSASLEEQFALDGLPDGIRDAKENDFEERIDHMDDAESLLEEAASHLRAVI